MPYVHEIRSSFELPSHHSKKTQISEYNKIYIYIFSNLGKSCFLGVISLHNTFVMSIIEIRGQKLGVINHSNHLNEDERNLVSKA